MKQFFKNVAATIVGIFGFGIIMVILAVITLIGMMCNSSKTPSLKDNSVMVMKLQGQISDQANDDWLGQLTGNQYNNLGMNNILSAIKKAKQEDKVKGIYLETGILSTDYATLQEIRSALADFKKSGKWIIAYGDAMTQGGILPGFGCQQGICEPGRFGRLARYCLTDTIYKRCGCQIWRSLHHCKGGQIQELHRDVHRGQDERCQPRTGYPIYRRSLESDSDRCQQEPKHFKGFPESLCRRTYGIR